MMRARRINPTKGLDLPLSRWRIAGVRSSHGKLWRQSGYAISETAPTPFRIRHRKVSLLRCRFVSSKFSGASQA